MAAAVERFPPPDFTSGHELPETVTPAALGRGGPWPWFDVAALALALGWAAWFALRRRSRAGLVGLSVVSLAYFGFWRRGCVCAIGSIQNVALAAADATHAVPWEVIGFFALPLMVALVWGRAFCAGACPHGAIQDLVLVRPLKVPPALDAVLRLGPWVYLALAVLFAATGGWFIICKYDPFVPVFRMAGPRVMFVVAAAMLGLSMFVGRPYCRWLCPYGALLGLAARVAKFRPRVTPAACTRCRLCEASCPFGVLNHAAVPDTPAGRIAARRCRFALMVIALPVAAVVFGLLGGRAGHALAAVHPTGRLAALVAAAPEPGPGVALADEVVAFRQAGGDREVLRVEAAALADRSAQIGAGIGVVFGVMAALHLVRAWFPPLSDDYEPDRADCVACARCFKACPYEWIRRGVPVEPPVEGGSGG